MTPTIKEGSEVLVSGVPYLFSKPKVGDAVAFRSLNKVLIKRIKKVRSDHYLLEGDNMSDSLEVGWIDRKNILGKVIIKLL